MFIIPSLNFQLFKSYGWIQKKKNLQFFQSRFSQLIDDPEV